MIMQVLGSGSSGNCYILTSDSGQRLIIEAGVNFKKIQEAIEFDYPSVIGVLNSHSHGDHSCSSVKCTLSGLNVYSGNHTIEFLKEKGANQHRLHTVKSEEQFKVGEYKIMALPVRHDVPCMSFLIAHAEMGKTLFVTDTILFPYKIPGLTNIMAEANFDQDILDERDAEGKIHSRLRDRVIGSHMSINTLESLLSAQDLSKVNNIVVLHLSESNSNSEDFKSRVQRLTSKTVHIAEKGLKIGFNLRPW